MDPPGRDAVIGQRKGHIRILEDAGPFVEEFAPGAIAAALLEAAGRDAR